MNTASNKVIPTTLSDIGELGAIERIVRTLPGRQDVVVGAGDDCAVVRMNGHAIDDMVLTSDPVISGVHFTTDATPESIGHKALGRVLSDIAAMGAEPRWILVDIVAPGETPIDVIDGIYRGMGALASKFSVAIVGGDMAEGSSLEIHVFGVGAVPTGKGLLRSTASMGDLLFVTGKLGGSRLGRHLQVEPRINEGLFLRDWASAMIDVSDGGQSGKRLVCA
jgi:thiamine-monophosphate kinase